MEKIDDLNITRARISTKMCCVPWCNVGFPRKLHRIPVAVRYDIMKNKRFFIPAACVACDLHCESCVWPEITIQHEKSVFTSAQIEEMIDLLRSDPKSLRDTGKA